MTILRRVKESPFQPPNANIKAVILEGPRVTLTPLDPDKDALDVWLACHSNAEGHYDVATSKAMFAYMPYGPFLLDDESENPTLPNSGMKKYQDWFKVRITPDPSTILWCVRLNSKVIGCIALLDTVPSQLRTELGHIWMSSSVRGRGFGIEAATLLMQYAIENLGFRRVQWKCNPANIASRSLAEKGLFMTHEGTLRRNMVIYDADGNPGRGRDSVYFSNTDFEWFGIDPKDQVNPDWGLESTNVQELEKAKQNIDVVNPTSVKARLANKIKAYSIR